jgi:hypothetical protein
MTPCKVDGCPSRHYARGWCVKHYNRWRKHGDPLVSRTCPREATDEERLRFTGWTEVVRRPDLGPCWEWDGGTSSTGYGVVDLGRRQSTGAHRLAHKVWIGPLADDEKACHRCDNPPCMNPGHLFAGSAGDNMADMVTKNRDRNGERHANAKLSDADVAAIRATYTGQRGEQVRLAEHYGVSRTYVNWIVRDLRRTRPTNPAPLPT